MSKVKDTVEAWERRALGADASYVQPADEAHEAALDEALGLQSISIRLPKQLIDQYKLIAHFHGVGYQPLMRDVMSRFVPNALREILEIEQDKAKTAAAKSSGIDKPPKKVSTARAAAHQDAPRRAA